ncbi:unnamed protein product [Ixodes pacificus]
MPKHRAKLVVCIFAKLDTIDQLNSMTSRHCGGAAAGTAHVQKLRLERIWSLRMRSAHMRRGQNCVGVYTKTLFTSKPAFAHTWVRAQKPD